MKLFLLSPFSDVQPAGYKTLGPADTIQVTSLVPIVDGGEWWIEFYGDLGRGEGYIHLHQLAAMADDYASVRALMALHVELRRRNGEE